MSTKFSKILYVSSVTSQSRFDQECRDKLRAEGHQNQKFHNLLLRGLSKVFDGSIEVVSKPLPSKSVRVKKLVEIIEGITYYHPSTLRIPILRQLLEYTCSKRQIKRLISKDMVIICNAMDEFLTYAAIDAARCKGVKICGVVTDVPGYTSGAGGTTRGIKGYLLKKLLKKSISSSKQYDAYILLAEAMNSIVNPLHKPFIVIEGFSDARMKEVVNTVEGKAEPKTMLYAGGIHKEYGIKTLVEAYISVNPSDWQLIIYGMGNYREELLNVCKTHQNVIYKGVATNDVIIREQLRASLLVNPRPTNEEFVKYSFPSKTMECMASGTPLITTRLPSMPVEYYPHVYFFDDESTKGIAKALTYVMSLPIEKLHEKGSAAKSFVLNNKSNIGQAKKLICFLNDQ